MNWWQRLFRDNQLERDLDRELQYHLDRQVEDQVRTGMRPHEVSRLLRTRFGAVEQVKEECRDARGTRWVRELLVDCRYGMRLAARDRATTAIAVVALALGIGVNSTFFTVVNAVCLRGLPIDRATRVLVLQTRDLRAGDQELSYPEFRDVAARARAFEGLAAFATTTATLADRDRAPERVNRAFVSSELFPVLHEQPLMGRDFTSLDFTAGAAPVVVLSARIWNARFGRALSAVGASVRVDGRTSTVVGVMPEGMRFPDNADVWQPLSQLPGLSSDRRSDRRLTVAGRLRDDATLDGARAELQALGSSFARAWPETNRDTQLLATPINERYSGRVTDTVWLAFLGVGLLTFLVASGNVANLLLMRAVERAHELGVRLSLGATRLRLARQLLAESVVVAALAGATGLALSLIGARLLSITLSEQAPYWLRFTMDGRAVLALVSVSAGSVVICGLAPAFFAARTDIRGVLQSAGRGGTRGPQAARVTSFFVIAEFALTTVLLAALVVGVRGYRAALAADVPFVSSDLLTAWISLPLDRYPSTEQRVAFYDRLGGAVRGTDTISSLALASALPLGGAIPRTLSVVGRARPAAMVATVAIDGPYFEALGVSIRRGRGLAVHDAETGHSGVVVNQRFASIYFPGADPLGRSLRLGRAGSSAWSDPLTIVGLAPDLRQSPQGVAAEPVVYLPLRVDPPETVAVLLRHAPQAAESVAPTLRQAVKAIDPDVSLDQMMAMDDVLHRATLNGRVSQALITTVAMIALALSVVGLYAVTANAVMRRRREFGVRAAMGARPGHVMRIVMGRALRQLGFGLAGGIVCTLAWQRVLPPPQGSGPAATDVATLAIVAGIVTLVALTACVVPARRAARLEPTVALRHD